MLMTWVYISFVLRNGTSLNENLYLNVGTGQDLTIKKLSELVARSLV